MATAMSEAVLPEVSRRAASGLCRTCAHAEHCTFPKHENRPILQCDEIDALFLPPVALTGPDRLPPSVAAASATARVPALRGLCVNCDRRHDCTYPKPETGVWHCEEYT